MMFVEKVCYMKKKKSQTDQYRRLTELSLKDVMDVLVDYQSNPDNYPKGRHSFYGLESVNIASLRLKTFAIKGTMCSVCGLEGTHFAIERCHYPNRNRDSSEYQGYHLNLWATDWKGDEILMTHDHTLARGLGGSDSIENTETMCVNCNGTKARFENQEITRLRQLEEGGSDVTISGEVRSEVVCVPSRAEG